MPAEFKDGYVSRNELSKRWKVTNQTVKNYEKRGLPIDHRDPGTTGTTWYILDKAEEWYVKEFGLDDDDLTELELRKKRAETVLAEIKVEKERLTLVPIDLVVSIVANELANVRSKLIAIPGLVAPHIYIDSLAERIAVLEDAVEQCLEEIQTDSLKSKDWKKLVNDRQNR